MNIISKNLRNSVTENGLSYIKYDEDLYASLLRNIQTIMQSRRYIKLSSSNCLNQHSLGKRYFFIFYKTMYKAWLIWSQCFVWSFFFSRYVTSFFFKQNLIMRIEMTQLEKVENIHFSTWICKKFNVQKPLYSCLLKNATSMLWNFKVIPKYLKYKFKNKFKKRNG